MFQCSYYPSCKSEHTENVEEVHEFRNMYGRPGESMQCFYNPYSFNEVGYLQQFYLIPNFRAIAPEQRCFASMKQDKTGTGISVKTLHEILTFL